VPNRFLAYKTRFQGFFSKNMGRDSHGPFLVNPSGPKGPEGMGVRKLLTFIKNVRGSSALRKKWREGKKKTHCWPHTGGIWLARCQKKDLSPRANRSKIHGEGALGSKSRLLALGAWNWGFGQKRATYLMGFIFVGLREGNFPEGANLTKRLVQIGNYPGPQPPTRPY